MIATSTNFLQVAGVKMDSNKIKVNDSEEEKAEDVGEVFPWTNEKCFEQMKQVAGFINDVSNEP